MARRLFLERRTYRRNRLQDAARLLPILGAALIFAPIFLRDTAEATETVAPPSDLSQWLIYYFVIWIGLIALTALVSRSLTGGLDDRAEADEPASSGAGSDRSARG